MVFECDVTPNPDMFPDVWNDMFLKRLATAYVQRHGVVLTRYQSVQFPGGITMNGDQIYTTPARLLKSKNVSLWITLTTPLTSLVDRYTLTNPLLIVLQIFGRGKSLDDLVMEQIGIYGIDLLFMPRKLVNMDKIFHESPKSAFEMSIPSLCTSRVLTDTTTEWNSD